jgi:hypothetical protein
MELIEMMLLVSLKNATVRFSFELADTVALSMPTLRCWHGWISRRENPGTLDSSAAKETRPWR